MKKGILIVALREALDRTLQPVATLLYGSRVYGDALPESDLDAIIVVDEMPDDEMPDDDETAETARLISAELGVRVDLKATTRRGAAFSHVMSPEWRVALLTGERYGDWSWLDLSLPLSWQGADDYLGDTEAQFEAIRDWRDDEAVWLADMAKICRRLLTLKAAMLGSREAALETMWERVAARLFIPLKALRPMRSGGDPDPVGNESAACAEAVVESLLEDVRNAVAVYPRNAGDAFLSHLLAGAEA